MSSSAAHTASGAAWTGYACSSRCGSESMPGHSTCACRTPGEQQQHQRERRGAAACLTAPKRAARVTVGALVPVVIGTRTLIYDSRRVAVARVLHERTATPV